MAGPTQTEDIQKDLDQLDKRITGLKVAYDQYFLGIEKFEPLKEREAVKKFILDLEQRFMRNTGAKFRRDSLKAKFLSYARYWDRILKQIEDGTYKGHMIKAKLHEQERLAKKKEQQPEATATAESAPLAAAPRAPGPPTPTNGARPADPVQRIFDQYVAAKRKAGESTDGLTRDKLASVIQQQSAALKQKFNCKSVEFRVVVEDGKAKLKAVPKT